MGRPRSPDKKTEAVQVRFSSEEKEAFDRLIESRNEELKKEGLTASAPNVIRWLVMREIEARGLSNPSPKSKKASREK